MEWCLKLESGVKLELRQVSPTEVRLRFGGAAHYVDAPITVVELMRLAEVIGQFTNLGEN